jgi:hypothetical protein
MLHTPVVRARCRCRVQVNFFAVLAMTNAVAPIMIKQRQGTIGESGTQPPHCLSATRAFKVSAQQIPPALPHHSWACLCRCALCSQHEQHLWLLELPAIIGVLCQQVCHPRVQRLAASRTGPFQCACRARSTRCVVGAAGAGLCGASLKMCAACVRSHTRVVVCVGGWVCARRCVCPLDAYVRARTQRS